MNESAIDDLVHEEIRDQTKSLSLGKFPLWPAPRPQGSLGKITPKFVVSIQNGNNDTFHCKFSFSFHDTGGYFPVAMAHDPSPSRPEKPTVIDVARAAKVAVGTVSRVLNTPELVGADLRQHVLDTIERLSYRPLRRRRNGRHVPGFKKRRGNIGVVFLAAAGAQDQSSFLSDALRGIEMTISAANENLMLANISGRDRVPLFLTRGLVDGLIVRCPLVGDLHSNVDPALLDSIESLPHIWLAGQPKTAKGDVVECDVDAVGRMAADYLHGHGHRHIAFLDPHPERLMGLSARQTFGFFAEAHGMSCTDLIGPGSGRRDWPNPMSVDAGVVASLVGRWQDSPESGRPTVLLVNNDEVAVTVMAALQDLNLRAGREVSVMSLRRDNELSAALEPALATIDHQPEVMGNRAVQHLRWRVERIDDSGYTRVRVEPQVVDGSSVASIN